MIHRLNADEDAILFVGSIADNGPKFETRSLYLDHARSFHGLDTTRTLLDVMQSLNMNQLHMKMSDDEGWRLQIDGLPELTDFGSNRCHDPTGKFCLMPQLGS